MVPFLDDARQRLAREVAAVIYSGHTRLKQRDAHDLIPKHFEGLVAERPSRQPQVPSRPRARES